jgi:hypothetical protein
MVSRYPNAAAQYDQRQLDQLTKTLINDLTKLSQPIALGYNAGAFAPMSQLIGGGRTYGVGSVGTVSVQTNGGISVAVNSGTDPTTYNLAEALAALIIDLQTRGMLG